MNSPLPPAAFGRTSISESPRDPYERARFDAWCTATMRTYAPLVGAGVVAAVVLWWPLDRVIYANEPHIRATFAETRLALASFLTLCSLILPRLAFIQRHALVTTATVTVIASGLASFHLSHAGGDDPFWLAFFYIAPLFSVAFLFPPVARLISSLAIGVSVAAGYLLATGDSLDSHETRSAMSYLVFTSLMSATLGHAVYLLVRTNFLMQLRVDEQRVHLAELTDRLEERVAEQTAELRLLHRRAQEAGAEQQRRIARDLHDGLGQELSTLRLLAGHGQGVANEAPSRELFGELEGLVERVQLSLRRVLQTLRPRLLDEQGLVEGLRTLLSDTERRWGLRTALDLGPLPDPCPSGLSVALFRIAQEGIHNVLRHAYASELVLRLRQEGAWIVLEVQDNGLGMSSTGEGGHGLDNIRERAAEMGGEASWEQGGGTLLRVRLPVENS
ncbi:sensor histidine kinase [Myxococcota bacterium]|nr:sensor histidine kinase [Myxococcota bacterium]